ncbi:Uncharacterized protein BP5553_01666 [Venustampulla echinocandica]|uniref:Uncharacterized protein n=1 Tax=Venustampulla echinocandica TaxID=2656787 RepID=A0A370U1P5_9HELO|nr:Uncharacterized protein BP5553_01666 [Venustampulla echinocandica]RDL41687.1 Uncharacterized protein BP5553_01666 [Venustampulla echinocandica]
MAATFTSPPHHIKAPTPLPKPLTTPSIFLSGSISPPNTPCWRSRLINSLSHLPITILDPLRPDWDSSWKEEPSSPQFLEQVSWELHALEQADIVAIYFGAETTAPVTLLEFGFAAGKGKRVVVCCQEGYQKRGNVQILCDKLGIDVVPRPENFPDGIIKALQEFDIGAQRQA